MHDPISLRRVLGVDVRMDWSWPLLVFAFFVSLTASLLATHPRWPIGLSTGLAALAALGLVASLLAREALQILAARRLGAPMGSLTLFVAGSQPVYLRARRSAVREALVATIGPVFHAALGLGLLALAGMIELPVRKLFLDPAGVLRMLPEGATVIAWIGLANLAVAALDALPAYPLAGGRVLRSILWEATGDHRLATTIVARIGQAIAVALIVTGIASAFRLGPRTIAEGVWLLLAGVTLLHAATASIRTAAWDARAAGTAVRQLMRPVVRMITPDASLATAAVQHFVGASSRALPVVSDGACVGVLRFEDLRKVPPREWADRPVKDAMLSMHEVPHVEPGTDLGIALLELVRRDASVAPVIDGHDVVGLIETADVVRWVELAEPEPIGGPEPIPEESIDWREVMGLTRRGRLSGSPPASAAGSAGT